jgi:twinkle protein
MHYGTLWSIGGGVGSGKTLLVHSIAAHIIKKNIPVACFMLEERLGKSLVNISTHLSNCRIGLFEADKLGQVIHDFDLNNNLHLWKNKGQNDWDNIAQCIRFYAVVLGVKVFFVDNVTAITNTLSPTEQNTEIARVATEAHGLADELDIAVVLLSHLNPPSSGPSHEEGGEVRPVQFTGSRALMRWSDVMIGFERNLYAEGEYKHHSKIRVIKDREAGKTGVIKTIYDVETGGLYERVEESTEEAESW